MDPIGETLAVVFHINSQDDNSRSITLANVANLLDDTGDQAQVEVVFNGPAVVHLLKQSSSASQIRDLAHRGVLFVACANSLRAQNLSASDLLAEVKIVPAGVTHLVRRQQEGWAYIHP
jgi:intracellular sulfur oxidation DsrE/DsrF family protein